MFVLLCYSTMLLMEKVLLSRVFSGGCDKSLLRHMVIQMSLSFGNKRKAQPPSWDQEEAGE